MPKKSIKSVKKSEDNSKTLLVLLVIIIVASLVIDLLSLNVLYGIDKESSLKEELAIIKYYKPFSCPSGTIEVWRGGNRTCEEINKGGLVDDDDGRITYPGTSFGVGYY